MWKRPPDDKADPVTRTRALETPDGPSGLEQVSKNKKIYGNQVPRCWRKEPAVSPRERLGWASSPGPGIGWTAGGSQCSKYTHTERTDRHGEDTGQVCVSTGATPAQLQLPPTAQSRSGQSRQAHPARRVWGLTTRTHVSLWETQQECGACRGPRKRGCTRKRAGTCQRDKSGTVGTTTDTVGEIATRLHG